MASNGSAAIARKLVPGGNDPGTWAHGIRTRTTSGGAAATKVAIARQASVADTTAWLPHPLRGRP